MLVVLLMTRVYLVAAKEQVQGHLDIPPQQGQAVLWQNSEVDGFRGVGGLEGLVV